MGRKLEPVEREEAKEKERTHTKSGYAKLAHAERGKTRDKVAEAVGMKHTTYEKAKEVVEAAEEEPEKYGHLKEKMDKTGKVDPVHKEYKKARKEEAKERERTHAKTGYTKLAEAGKGEARDNVVNYQLFHF